MRSILLQMKWTVVQRSGKRDNQVPLEKLQAVLARLEGGIYMLGVGVSSWWRGDWRKTRLEM